MALEAYPTDEMGMPMAVLIPDLKQHEGQWDRHHPWYYARYYFLPELGATAGSRIVRATKKQAIMRVDHIVVHDVYEAGVERPEDEIGEIKHTLFNLAGRVSSEGVQVAKGNVNVVEINPYRKKLLRRTNVFVTEKEPGALYEIGEHLLGFVVKNGFPAVIADQESLVTEFSELPHGDVREESIRFLIREAAAVALSPWEALYKQEREAQVLRIDAPSEPADVFMGSIKRGIPDLSVVFQKTVEKYQIDMPEPKTPSLVD